LRRGCKNRHFWILITRPCQRAEFDGDKALSKIPKFKRGNMSVRSKILIILVSVLLVFECLDIVIQKTAVYSKFVQLENSEALKDVSRCLDAIDREIFHLTAFNADWAYWDDAYNFAQSKSPEFVKANLTDSTFKDSKLDMLCFYDSSGKLIWGKIYDVNQNEMTVKRFSNGLEAGDPLMVGFNERNPDRYVKRGIVLTERGPVLVVSRPILQSSKQGPPRGVLVMGRFMDDEMITELSGQTKVNLTLSTLNSELSLRQKKALAQTKKTRAVCIDTPTRGPLMCSAMLKDINDNPAVLLTVLVPRNITTQGREALTYALGSGFVVFVIVLGVLLVVLNVSIIKPLLRLTGLVTSIADTSELNERLNFNRTDEIGVLARQFDIMLEHLNTSRRQLMDSSYINGKAEVASGVLHNLRNSLTPVVTAVETLRSDLHEAPLDKIDLAKKQLASDGLDPAHKADLEKYVDLAGERVTQVCVTAQHQLDTLACRIRDIEAILGSSSLMARSQRVNVSISLNQLITESIAMVSKDLLAGMEVQIDETVRSAPLFKSDRIALLQVFVNLIVNAAESIKTADSKPGRIKITLCHDEPGAIHLVFADNGTGVAPADITRLFDRGYSTKAKADPSGIGLHWCANTIQTMNGRIWIESEGPGKGASAHVRLPIQQESKIDQKENV
jgi:two-component system NtrC family sensor kinase